MAYELLKIEITGSLVNDYKEGIEKLQHLHPDLNIKLEMTELVPGSAIGDYPDNEIFHISMSHSIAAFSLGDMHGRLVQEKIFQRRRRKRIGE
jgi:hypothetical protein